MRYFIISILLFSFATSALAADASPRFSTTIATWLVRLFHVPARFVAPGPEGACALGSTPVCGLDGKTYANRCEAGDAAIAIDGPCPSAEPQTPLVQTMSTTTLKLPPFKLPTIDLRQIPGLFGNIPTSTVPLTQTPRQFLPTGEIPPKSAGPAPTFLDLLRELFLKPRT